MDVRTYIWLIAIGVSFGFTFEAVLMLIAYLQRSRLGTTIWLKAYLNR